MGFTRQSQGENIREDFGRGSADASGAGDERGKLLGRMLVVEAQICQEHAMHIDWLPM